MSSGDVFKTGLLVDDLEQAMKDLGRWLNLEWTPVQASPLTLETAHGREEVLLRFVYSRQGPPFFELLEAQPSGYYAAPEGPHLHHIGRWVDDLAAASESLAQAGLPLEAAGVGADGQAPAIFAFHRGAHGARVELVDRSMQATFEGWLSGGDLDLGS